MKISLLWQLYRVELACAPTRDGQDIRTHVMVDVGGVDFSHPSCASQTKGLTWPGVGDLGLTRASGGVKGLPPPTTRTKQVKEGGWSRLCGFLVRSPGLSLCFFPSGDDPHRPTPGPTHLCRSCSGGFTGCLRRAAACCQSRNTDLLRAWRWTCTHLWYFACRACCPVARERLRWPRAFIPALPLCPG